MADPLTPFDLVFHDLADERFSTVQETLAAAGQEARNRDAFLLNREVGMLLRELRPDEGMGEAIDHLVGLLHHAYLMWEAGGWTYRVSRERAQSILDPGQSQAGPPHARSPAHPPGAYYLQWPSKLVWGQLTKEGPHEPLDGWFVSPSGDESTLRVLGVFGLHPERMGFSVVEAAGPRLANLARPDGSPLFAPVLDGGGEAGLYSLVGADEMLELAWRSRDLPRSGEHDPTDQGRTGGNVVDIP